MANRPLTAADRRCVRELHAAGKSRNEIARAIKRSSSTVSKIAEDLGLTFDRSATAAATQARSIDLADRRVTLAEKLHEDAERLREQLWGPCITGAFGGKDNTWSQVHLERPLFGDQRQILAAASIAVEKSLKLAPPKDDNGATEVGAMLTSLFESLRAEHGGE